MKIAFVLAGLHRFERGAEVALLSVARELALAGEQVTLIGSGEARPDTPYHFIHAGSIRREKFERFPAIPLLRSETVYEEATFALSLLAAYRPADYDVTVTCSYPFTNWVLRRPALSGKRPLHVFVTQNGDWPAHSNDAEYRFFGCDGLVCTNPDYFERNAAQWTCLLTPNGIDVDRFVPGAGDRAKFGFPADRKVILMVSAFIPTKRVEDGIRAVSRLPDAHLVVAGDGPLRDEVDRLAAELLPGRFSRMTVAASDMPLLYQSADVFLHMSKEESFGNVYVEAMACGLPVVGHDTPRLRWIVGDDEYLADTTNLDATAASLTAALSDSDAQKEARVARSRGFSWAKIAQDYRAFFERLLAARTSP